MILSHAGNFDADYVFAVVITILIEAVVLMNLAQNLEKWLLPWRSGLADEG
jgi:ABC-type nitrate/sulfonate/bicarbonate transport system permease component